MTDDDGRVRRKVSSDHGSEEEDGDKVSSEVTSVCVGRGRRGVVMQL